MLDFWINITTYQRERPLRRLLNQIKEMGKGYSIKGMIIIDCCPYNQIRDWQVINLPYRNGRQGFYLTINLAFKELRNQNFKYFLNLQDDIILKENFFDRCIENWEGIKDPDKIVLDLRTDERVGQSIWGIYPVERIGKYYKSQWMDLVFMSDSRFKDRVPILDYCNIDSSSGVARTLTKRFRKKGFNMYHTSDKLVSHGHLPSLMNPEIRKTEKLIC